MAIKKNKKILLVGWFFYPKLGGVESIMLNQANFFINQGYEIAVLTSKIEKLPDNDNFQNIKIYRREFINSEVAFSKSTIREGLIKILDSFNPSIVHFHNGSYPAASNDMNAGAQNIKAIFAILKAKGIFVIDHAHNAQLKNPDITQQLRNLPWDTLICVSHFVEKRWKSLGTQAKKIQVIYNSIDLKRYSNVLPNRHILEIKKHNEKIIFFPSRVVSMSLGRISRQKNFILVLKACGLLKENINNFKLVAILNKSEREINTENAYKELDNLIVEYNLKENISFIEPVEPDKMPSYYSASDIICVPSIEETFGLVYIEAMASGKVVIASDTGGPKEYIKDNENGFLVSPGDFNTLAKKLSILIEDPEIITKIGLKARKTAQNFSIEKMMKQIEKIYNGIL